jgi:hypothetical protein
VQALLRCVGDSFDLGLADQIDHDLRIEEADDYPARRLFAHDHVARQ